VAFYDPEKDEEQAGNQGGAVQVGPESGVVGQGSQAPASSSAGASPAGGASSAPKRDSFVNISDYINANKPQSEKLAGQVVGAVNSKADAADSALSGAQNSFNQAADSQKVTADDSLFGQVANNAESVTKDPNLSNSFSKAYNATYAGPQKLEDLDSGNAWTGIQNALSAAKTAKDETNTEAGRMQLIKGISNNPRQSQGGLVFDNLLLQSNPNSAAELQQAGSSLNGFDKKLTDAQSSAANKAKSVADANAATKSQAANAVNQGYNNLYGASAGADGQYGTADDENLNLSNSLTGRVASTKGAQDQAYKDFQDRLTNNRLTDDDYKSLGISKGTNLYTANPANYLKENQDANIQNVANQTDYDRLAALSSLAGSAGPGFLNPTTDANLMGKAGRGFDVDQSGLSNKINSDKQDYTAKLNSLVNGDIGKNSPYTAEGIQNYTNWLTGGQPVAGMTQQSLTDFLNSDVGQKIAALAQQYGFNVQRGGTPIISGPGAPTSGSQPLVVKS
jgi:hypothetical protein